MKKALIWSFIILIHLIFFSCDTSPDRKSVSIAWADSISEHAVSMMSGKHKEMVLRFIDSAYSSIQRRDEQVLWRKYNTLAHYYTYYGGDFGKRRLYIDSMLLVSKRNGEKYGYERARSLYAMAVLLQERKEYNEAFKYYFEGRTLAVNNLDKCSMGDFTNALGIIRYRQEQYQQAIPYFKSSLEETFACASPTFNYGFIQPQGILNSIGLCFERSGQLDSAIFYYKKALQFIESRKGNFPENKDFAIMAHAVVEGNIGGTYAAFGYSTP